MANDIDVQATLARIDERTGWIAREIKRQQICDEAHEVRIRKVEAEVSTLRTDVDNQKNYAAQALGAGGVSGGVVTVFCLKLMSFFGPGGGT